MDNYERLELLNKSNDSDIYNCCYLIYKKDYVNNKDFSIKSDDITEEIDELINDYDNHKKARKHNDSNSLYSEMLEELGIKI